MASPHDGTSGPPSVERRRHPRQRPDSDVGLSLPATYNAEVLDISSGGALISTPAQVVKGQRAHLRTLLEREPFSAVVEVLRVDIGTRSGSERRNHVGVGFVSLDDNSRKTLTRFVRGARNK